MPRTYDLGKRKAAVEATRRRILDAARRLLSAEGFHGVSVDDVARAADVTRVTVYNQFGSKLGLLEAVFDDIGERGQSRRMGESSAHPDPRQALRDVVSATHRFWAHDRTAIRRIAGLAGVDPEAGQVVASREARRERLMGELVARLDEAGALAPGVSPREATQALRVLTQFATYDALASLGAAAAERLILLLAGALVRGLEEPAPAAKPR